MNSSQFLRCLPPPMKERRKVECPNTTMTFSGCACSHLLNSPTRSCPHALVSTCQWTTSAKLGCWLHTVLQASSVNNVQQVLAAHTVVSLQKATLERLSGVKAHANSVHETERLQASYHVW